MTEPSASEAVYAHLVELTVDDIVTYEKLTDIIGREFTDYRAPLYQAQKWLELKDSHTLINIKNVGYRIAKANEHEKVGRVRYEQGRRKVIRAATVVTNVDRSSLTAEERTRVESLEITLSRHATMLARLNGRQARTEELVKTTHRQTQGDLANLQTQMDRLQAALERRGIPVPAGGADD